MNIFSENVAVYEELDIIVRTMDAPVQPAGSFGHVFCWSVELLLILSCCLSCYTS
jgi:hypothetical protein